MPGSCALSCHIALEWAGADYTIGVLDHDEVHGERFLAVNPKGKVPALKLEGGTIVTEAIAILALIAARHPDADLHGRTPLEQARILEALSELTGEFHPAFAPLHVPGRYAADEGAHDSVQATARDRVREHFDHWNARMENREWIVGVGKGRRTIVDAYLLALTRWTGQIDAELDEWPNLARFAARLMDDPGVRAALTAEGLGEEITA